MSLLKIFEKFAPLLALLAVLATFALVAWSIQSVESAYQHSAERAHAADNDQPPAETWTIQRREDGSYEAQRQTTEAHEAEENVFGISPDGWIAIFTVVLAIATIGLIWATHRLGDRADKGLRQLERAYIHAVLRVQTETGTLSALEDIAQRADSEKRLLEIKFAFKNFGKTPATILYVEADWSFPGVVLKATAHYLTKITLGEGDESNDLPARIEITPEQARDIIGEKTRLMFAGFVNYVDIFDKEQGQTFAWRFERKARRMIPVHQPRRKQT